MDGAMQGDAGALTLALGLIAGGDPGLWAIIRLSLGVSLAAVAIGAVLGLPLGAFLAVERFPGAGALIVVVNALMGLPPVVVGLAVYLLLSRAGPLGSWGLLFTPQAMVIAQAVLVTPIIAGLARQTIAQMWEEYEEAFRSFRISPPAAVPALLWDARFALFTAVLAGFGRASAEVGAILIVGGNIDGLTRTMTTAIALETQKGDLPLALALGFVLLGVVLAVNAAADAVRRFGLRQAG
jgi:tungstate transport system permease protein